MILDVTTSATDLSSSHLDTFRQADAPTESSKTDASHLMLDIEDGLADVDAILGTISDACSASGTPVGGCVDARCVLRVAEIARRLLRPVLDHATALCRGGTDCLDVSDAISIAISEVDALLGITLGACLSEERPVGGQVDAAALGRSTEIARRLLEATHTNIEALYKIASGREISL